MNKNFGNETKRINISVGADFLEHADVYAKQHHMSRSALLQKSTVEFVEETKQALFPTVSGNHQRRSLLRIYLSLLLI